MAINGISVVICCYNSAARLPETLAALALQQVSCRWEVIIVDNASTDRTAEVATRCWSPVEPVAFRVVHEDKPGLSHARMKGLAVAEYDVVAFIDDDNWLGKSWLDQVRLLFDGCAELGAAGGQVIPVYEEAPPDWVHEFATALAITKAGRKSGALALGEHICGAGMAVRKTAWRSLERAGFEFMSSDRSGSALLGGGDVELCYALQLAGWELWYSEVLVLQHFIPKNRCTWNYFRKLFRGHGVTSLVFEPYQWALSGRPSSMIDSFRKHWLWQLAATLKAIASQTLKPGWRSSRSREGNRELLMFESRIGRLRTLAQLRGHYTRSFGHLRKQQWVRMSVDRGVPCA